MFAEHLARFCERFPKWTLVAPSWPRGQAVSESLQMPDPGKAEALYVFGLGGGAPYLQLRSWLQEKKERRLIFLEEDPAAVTGWLRHERAKEMIADSQVHIELFSTRGELDALAEQFPLKRIEVIAIPSKRGARFRALRLHLFRKTTLSHALHLDRLHGYQPAQNFVRNLRHLPTSFYANRLAGAFSNVPAIVCGAGPSLDKAIASLHTLKTSALLIAGGSAIAALSSKGIRPHFGVAIDPNLEEYRRMRNSFAFEMPLLYSTRVFPQIFQTCNGPFGYLRSGIGGLLEVWMEEELGLFDPLIGEHLSAESISVTAISTAWAQYLGCNPILFSGVDLAYTGKKRYAAGVVDGEEETPFARLDAEKAAADRILKRRGGNGQTVHTAVRWVMEAASLSHFAKKHRDVAFFNTSCEGLAIPGVPFRPLEEAVPCAPSDLYGAVAGKIAAAKMPPETAQVIEEKVGELKESLGRVISHLEILSGKRKGSKPLAEIELQDEMAMQILFYDSATLFSPEEKWSSLLHLALQYGSVAFL